MNGRGLQLVVLAGHESRIFDLPASGSVTIGRGEGCGVRIDDLSVSRNHAVIHVGPTLVIEDLGGANGTMIRDRGEPLAPAETLNVRHLVRRRAGLSVGDTLLLGTACVVVRHAPVVEVFDLAAPADEVVVRDPPMRAVYAQAALIAPTPINVVLLGETGVGKEVLARAIHAGSLRAKGPFHAMNCAALSESLLESELFGHEKGAFTGALQARTGLFEASAGGTVLLDEVGELSPAAQAKLLRVLEQRVVTRVGSNRPREIDVRFVAATNRDLEADCQTGRFRRDLYFRLCGISLHIPPLRERPREIDHLARKFLVAACRMVERSEVPRMSSGVLDHLRAYTWPGNVRELRNVIERAVALCPANVILPEHLPTTLIGTSMDPASSRGAPLSEPPGEQADLRGQIRSLERSRILETLERCRGSQSQAARILGISRRTLISRIEAFGLSRPRKRADSART